MYERFMFIIKKASKKRYNTQVQYYGNMVIKMHQIYCKTCCFIRVFFFFFFLIDFFSARKIQSGKIVHKVLIFIKYLNDILI